VANHILRPILPPPFAIFSNIWQEFQATLTTTKDLVPSVHWAFFTRLDDNATSFSFQYQCQEQLKILVNKLFNAAVEKVKKKTGVFRNLSPF
jgi:hypothetical protein